MRDLGSQWSDGRRQVMYETGNTDTNSKQQNTHTHVHLSVTSHITYLSTMDELVGWGRPGPSSSDGLGLD